MRACFVKIQWSRQDHHVTILLHELWYNQYLQTCLISPENLVKQIHAHLHDVVTSQCENHNLLCLTA